jgi:hypothetical protein
MKLRRSPGLAAALAAVALLPACNRRKPAEVNPIVPSFKVNRERAPLGSAIEITYTWTVEPGAKKLDKDYRALVHFLDSHEVMLFEDDHMPTPPPSAWEPGHTYTYTRTKFIPIYPYVGELEVRMGLYPHPGRGERLALKAEDKGLREYKVARMELLPQTENIFLVYKEGWHNPEALPDNPSVERTWTKKEALVSFKNPRKDVVVYLEADTCIKCLPEHPVLTMTIGPKVGLKVPVDQEGVFLKKVKVKAADLGNEEWVDLRLAMNQSFVPKLMTPPLNNDDRELGLLVYHLYVGEADRLGEIPGNTTVDAAPLEPASAAKAPAAKPKAPSPAPAASPPAKKG